MEQHLELQYDQIEPNEEYKKIIQKVVDSCFKHENLDKLKLYISITLTVPNIIREYNKKYREIDKETDVLSFPMFEKDEIQSLISEDYEVKDVLGAVGRIWT